MGCSFGASVKMVSIQIDEQTAKSLETAAAYSGISVAEYIRLLIPTPMAKRAESWDTLEREFTELSVEIPSPLTYSREDIYADHD
jgi:hypothetical protein